MMLTEEEEAVVFVMDLLDACGAEWMLTGSLASNIFGVTRSTQDADFVVEAGDDAIAEFSRGLDDRFQFNHQMSFETITMSTKYELELCASGFKIELFLLAG